MRRRGNASSVEGNRCVGKGAAIRAMYSRDVQWGHSERDYNGANVARAGKSYL